MARIWTPSSSLPAFTGTAAANTTTFSRAAQNTTEDIAPGFTGSCALGSGTCTSGAGGTGTPDQSILHPASRSAATAGAAATAAATTSTAATTATALNLTAASSGAGVTTDRATWYLPGYDRV